MSNSKPLYFRSQKEAREWGERTAKEMFLSGSHTSACYFHKNLQYNEALKVVSKWEFIAFLFPMFLSHSSRSQGFLGAKSGGRSTNQDAIENNLCEAVKDFLSLEQFIRLDWLNSLSEKYSNQRSEAKKRLEDAKKKETNAEETLKKVQTERNQTAPVFPHLQRGPSFSIRTLLWGAHNGRSLIP